MSESKYPTSIDQVWLVTGASTGFGRAIVSSALRRGFRVVAGARAPESLSDLVERHGDRVLPVRFDVTNPDDAEDAIAAGLAAFGAIDVLVNNAGYGYLAAIEEGEDSEFRALLETNLFGLAAVTRAILPVMRRQGAGVIVNISSGGGFVGLPGSGYYAASKFAVEGLSEALDREVRPLGLRVMLVEPGAFRTDWSGRSLRQSPQFISEYEQTAGRRRRSIVANHGRQRGDPHRAAEAIVDAVLADAPPFRLVLGPDALANIRAKLHAVQTELDAWEVTALSTDVDTADVGEGGAYAL
jgi:NAD(P)-dependent dehydrogenase (short-subunit alcohol dehydrogenase family)